jgi:hypothetical protein
MVRCITHVFAQFSAYFSCVFCTRKYTCPTLKKRVSVLKAYFKHNAIIFLLKEPFEHPENVTFQQHRSCAKRYVNERA